MFNLHADSLIFTRCMRAELSMTDAQRLKGSGWLNDAIIHLFMCMLQEKDSFLCKKRSSRKGSLFYDVNFMNIYLKDNNYNYNQVARYIYY